MRVSVVRFDISKSCCQNPAIQFSVNADDSEALALHINFLDHPLRRGAKLLDAEMQFNNSITDKIVYPEHTLELEKATASLLLPFAGLQDIRTLYMRCTASLNDNHRSKIFAHFRMKIRKSVLLEGSI